jgi:hypothetical protein
MSVGKYQSLPVCRRCCARGRAHPAEADSFEDNVEMRPVGQLGHPFGTIDAKRHLPVLQSKATFLPQMRFKLLNGCLNGEGF